MVISNTIKNDSGFYQCEVTADQQVWAVGTARLVVENNVEAPDAPLDLICVKNYSRFVDIEWSVAARSDIKAFTIHYMSLGNRTGPN